MPTEAQIIAQHGIKRPDITIRAAREAELELAVACAMLMGESGGGRMVWGSDAVQTGGAYVKGGPVTRENYLAYRALVRAGKIGRQGVGDAQLTSSEFQDRGDQLGGCWDPYANQLSGFIGLANRVKAYGLRGGLRRYNGSGPAAERYADRRMAEIAIWRARLSGAIPAPPPAPGDDMAAVPQVQWDKVYRQNNSQFDFSTHHGAPVDDQFGQVLSIRKELAELRALVEKLVEAKQ